MGRILVNGKYTKKSTYVLYKEDGTVYKTIREGEPFRIDNQMREWVPVRVPKRNGHGTILVCRKFSDSGDVLEEFPLPQGKTGLWATSSGSARNGVFHTYHAPQTELEAKLAKMGVSRNVIERVDAIDVELELGGQLCHHCTTKWGYGCATDGEVEDLTEPEYAPENHPNQYHRGCMVSTYKARIYEATYMVYYHIGTHMNGCEYHTIRKVMLTAEADEAKVIEALQEI